MRRGRLIFAFLAQIHRLDTQATAVQDPDGAGPLLGGYDSDFREPVLVDTNDDGIGERVRREPVLVDTNDDGIGERVRREHPALLLPCQVEPEAFDALQMAPAGNTPRSLVRLVFHFAHLEREGLIDSATGDARIRVGDRLGAIYDAAGELVQRIRTPPGLFVTEARPIGFGLWRPRPRRNLLLVSFDSRETAAPRGLSA